MFNFLNGNWSKLTRGEGIKKHGLKLIKLYSWTCFARHASEMDNDWRGRACSGSPLTFLHHACGHSELGGVIGGAVAFGLPRLLLGYD